MSEQMPEDRFWEITWMVSMIVVAFVSICLIGTLMVLGTMWLWRDLFPEAARQNIL